MDENAFIASRKTQDGVRKSGLVHLGKKPRDWVLDATEKRFYRKGIKIYGLSTWEFIVRLPKQEKAEVYCRRIGQKRWA